MPAEMLKSTIMFFGLTCFLEIIVIPVHKCSNLYWAACDKYWTAGPIYAPLWWSNIGTTIFQVSGCRSRASFSAESS